MPERFLSEFDSPTGTSFLTLFYCVIVRCLKQGSIIFVLYLLFMLLRIFILLYIIYYFYYYYYI